MGGDRGMVVVRKIATGHMRRNLVYLFSSSILSLFSLSPHYIDYNMSVISLHIFNVFNDS